ncbi:S9 family peptidase [Brevundimonas sp.]|uniref:S9 family peptidase n=1 Tax=Brevundimonas sp. TaxID=1871086 RepID=UPI004033C426
MRIRSHRRPAPALVALALAVGLAGPQVFVPSAWAQAPAQTTAAAPVYQQPPAPIPAILDAAPTPLPSVSPDRKTLALFERTNLPPIAELAEPMLRLGGYRINPRNNGPANSRASWLTGISLQPVEGGPVRQVALPADARFLSPSWSPDGRSIALALDRPTGLELWVVDVATARARKLTEARVNAATGAGDSWLPDSSGLIVRLTPADRGAAPNTDHAPTGPIVEESRGRTAPTRTYQDLLSDAGDEALFDHYFTSQLAVVPLSGAARMIGAPGVVLGASASPDGRYLLQTRVKRPYSYNVPAALFPTEVFVTDLTGRMVHSVADLPLRDDIPSAFDAVATGPRSVQWRDDADATLVWVEAQDGGDIRREAEVRDRVFSLTAPFTGTPATLIDLKERFAGVDWGDADTAILTSRWFNTRHETRYLIDPSKPGTGRVLLERNYQDRYNDPGSPLLEPNGRGRSLMQFIDGGRRILTQGAGATRQGSYPFLAAMDLQTGQSERLWTSAPGEYETLVATLDDEGRRLVTRRETKVLPPNIQIRDRASGAVTPLTAFSDPAPQLANVSRRQITYSRADGVQLSGTLYLPEGYDKDRDGPLPLVLWASPAEFTDAAVAGQVVDTDNRFVRPGGISHLFLLTQGYAMLDNPTMPIIGKDGAEPNDTYIEQLKANAEAAVMAVVDLGVADRDRIAVGGHSYGAFMTANLLAHTDLFRTGIARSGAYNRTLTPFGFQSEQRTYWEAPETYNAMSPFAFADKVNEPILLIHGQDDDNSGTFPVQSERFYAALKGNGATVRYVVLPLEAHGYRARESVGHTLWEMTRWLDQYVKTAPPRGGAAQ